MIARKPHVLEFDIYHMPTNFYSAMYIYLHFEITIPPCKIFNVLACCYVAKHKIWMHSLPVAYKY